MSTPTGPQPPEEPYGSHEPQQPGRQQPSPQRPGWQQPGWQQPGHQQPRHPNPGQQQPGYQQPGWQQPGWQQPGYQQPPGYAGRPPNGAMPLDDGQERTWALVSHLAPPLLALLSAGTLGFLTPLVVWLAFRDRSPYVEQQAKEALNFQITLVIAYIIGWLLAIVLVGFFILAAAWILSIVFGIMGAAAANRHEPYRYPINIRFVS